MPIQFLGHLLCMFKLQHGNPSRDAEVHYRRLRRKFKGIFDETIKLHKLQLGKVLISIEKSVGTTFFILLFQFLNARQKISSFFFGSRAILSVEMSNGAREWWTSTVETSTGTLQS